MYQLVISNQLEDLIEQHAQSFIPPSLWGQSRFYVLQNKSMEQWMRLKLTDAWSITAGLEFDFPDNRIRYFLEHSDLVKEIQQNRAILYMDDLKLLIYKHLEKIMENKEAIFTPIIQYFQYQQSEISSVLIYKMANQIAGLFHQYAMNASPLLDAWGKDSYLFPEGHNNHEDELWQRELWNIVFEDKYIHLGELIKLVIHSGQMYDGPVADIVLFGSVFLSHRSLEFFYYLSHRMNVTQYLLCPYYDPSFGENHPLLREWAVLIHDFFTLIEEKDINVIQASPIENTESYPMEVVHNNLRDNAPLSNIEERIRIHSFSSPLREVEGLKDQILDLIESGYKPEDIGVLAPDIRNYGTYIEGVFGSDLNGPSLPYNMIDLSYGSESPFIQAAIDLIDLLSSRFTRQDLYGLFHNPCIQKKIAIDDSLLKEWMEFLEDTNVRWGADKEFRYSKGASYAPTGTYDSGFQRFLTGIVISRDPYEGRIPYDPKSISMSRELAKLMKAHRRLFQVSKNWNSKKQNLQAWVLEFEELFLSLSGVRSEHPEDQIDRKSFRDVLRNLNALTDNLDGNDSFDSEMDFNLFQYILREILSSTIGSKGQYLTAGVTCSNLKPLRAIPFKVIFLLGMNEGEYPTEERVLSFDLSEHIDQIMRMDKRSTDLYGIIETLLSTRDKLFVFFNGVNPVNGENIPPSLMLEQLMEYRNSAQIIEHPLQSFNPLYYEEASSFFTYNQNAYVELQEVPHREIKYITEPDPIVEISMYDLFQFMRDPLSYHMKKVQGLDWGQMILLEEQIEDLRYLDRHKMISLIQDSLSDGAIEERIDLLRMGGFLPLDKIGLEEEKLLRDVFDKYKQQLSKTGLSQLGAPVPVVLTDHPRDSYDYQALTINMGRKDIVLKGSLRFLYSQGDGLCFWRTLMTSQVWQYHLLEGFMTQLVLNSSSDLKHPISSIWGGTKKDCYSVQGVDNSHEVLLAILRLYESNLKVPIPLNYELSKTLCLTKNTDIPYREQLQRVLNEGEVDRTLFSNVFELSKAGEDSRIDEYMQIMDMIKLEKVK